MHFNKQTLMFSFMFQKFQLANTVAFKSENFIFWANICSNNNVTTIYFFLLKSRDFLKRSLQRQGLSKVKDPIWWVKKTFFRMVIAHNSTFENCAIKVRTVSFCSLICWFVINNISIINFCLLLTPGHNNIPGFQCAIYKFTPLIDF